MNVKRYLKKKAEEDHQAILDANSGEFLHTLKNQVQCNSMPKRSSNRIKRWLIGVSSAIVSIIIIVCVVVFYPSASSIIYLEENFVYLDSTIEELNEDMKIFSIEYDSSKYWAEVKKTVDNLSGDVLFYSLNLRSHDLLTQIGIVTVCNSNFKYNNIHASDESETADLANYTIKYHTLKDVDKEFGIETLIAFGEIELGREQVYITSYSEFLLSPEGQFFDNIQAIIKTTNAKS